MCYRDSNENPIELNHIEGHTDFSEVEGLIMWRNESCDQRRPAHTLKQRENKIQLVIANLSLVLCWPARYSYLTSFKVK